MPAGASHPALLLLDVVSLSLPAEGPAAAAAAAADEEDEEEGLGGTGGGTGGSSAAASIALAQDPAAPELLYAVHCSGAHAITLSWLPLLAGLLEEEAEGSSGMRLPAALPQPAAELLLRSGPGVVAAAAVGDALSGSALIVLEADGKPQCLRPHRAAPAVAAPGDSSAAAGAAAGAAAAGATTPAGASAAQRDVDAQLATIYGDLRKGMQRL